MKKFLIIIAVMLFGVNAFAQEKAAMRPNADYIRLSFVNMGNLNMGNPVISVTWYHEGGTPVHPKSYNSYFTFHQILANGGRYDAYPYNQYPYDWLNVKVTVTIGSGGILSRYCATKYLNGPGGDGVDHITFYGSDFKQCLEAEEASINVNCES